MYLDTMCILSSQYMQSQTKCVDAIYPLFLSAWNATFRCGYLFLDLCFIVVHLLRPM